MLMNKGLTGRKFLILLAATALMVCFSAHGQVYKIVDKDGNVTYTDQAPGDGSEPMKLPELSVVSTDYEDSAETATESAAVEASEEQELTLRDVRKMYRGFSISSPSPNQTFWGTENSVVLGWQSPQPLQEGMTVQMIVDGVPQPESTANMMAMTMDRGEHSVSAKLLDARGRTLATTASVTFFIHQQTVRGNGP
jgi:hypothetical protein